MLQCLAEVLHFIKKQAISALTSEGTGPNGSPLQSTDPIKEMFVCDLTLSPYRNFFPAISVNKIKQLQCTIIF